MAISLSTSLCTSLATSLCEEPIPPVPYPDHLRVRYNLSGTVSHLAFVRYPFADGQYQDTIYWFDEDENEYEYYRYPSGDTTKEGQPMYAWWDSESTNPVIWTETENPWGADIWAQNDGVFFNASQERGWYIDDYAPGSPMYAWKCCDTSYIPLIYTTGTPTSTSWGLYKKEGDLFVESDAIIEESAGSIWTEEFTVLVLDEIDEDEYVDRVLVTVDGSTYTNSIQLFCIAPARVNSTITIAHDYGNIAPYWSNGSSATSFSVTIDPYSYGYQITRIYPADIYFSGEFTGDVTTGTSESSDATFSSSMWALPAGTEKLAYVDATDSFGHHVTISRTLTLDTWYEGEIQCGEWANYDEYPYLTFYSGDTSVDGAIITIEYES